MTKREGLIVAKFCVWVLDVLGAQHGDTVDDLFPGTGVMEKAWRNRCGSPEQMTTGSLFA